MPIPIKAMKQTAAMAKAIANSGAVATKLTDMERLYGGPECGSLAQEYLLSSNILPLGTAIELFGSEGTCKSTLAAHLMDRFILSAGGNVHYIENETKSCAPLVRSVLSEGSEDRLDIIRATTQEESQTVMTTVAKEVLALTHGKRRDSDPHLVGLVIDSYRVASEGTRDRNLADGHATKQFAQEALLWRGYLPSFMGLMLYSPIVFMAINHMVEKEAAGGYGKVKDSGGGATLKFYATYRILLDCIKTVEQKTAAYKDLTLRTMKNSNGPVGHKIHVRVNFRGPDIPVGKTVVDWAFSDAKLLTGPDIRRDELKKQGICNTKESTKAGLYSDDVLGLSCVPIEEITTAIYSDASRLAAFRALHDIKVFKTLDELWDAGWFFGSRTVGKDGEE